MTGVAAAAVESVEDVSLAAALLAIADETLGGASLAGLPGGAQEAWLAGFAAIRSSDGAPVRLSSSVSGVQLDGGIDVAATLATGKRVTQPGLIERAGGRPLILMGAERLSRSDAARLLAAYDAVAASGHASVILALDSSCGDDEGIPPGLADRLALRLVFDGIRAQDIRIPADWRRRVAEARRLLADGVALPDEILHGIVAGAAMLGIDSSRADRFAAAAARAHAAWRGAAVVTEEDAQAAVRLTLAHRARQMPAEVEAIAGADQSDLQKQDRGSREHASEVAATDDSASPDAIEDRLVQAVAAALPPGALDGGRTSRSRASKALQGVGKSRGPTQRSRRGRPVGHMAGDPSRDGPLHLLATIERAAPWQAARRRSPAHRAYPSERRLIVMPSDIRIVRFKHEAATLTIFTVDASGSSALNRMGEAKGAVELLLAQCYARREQIALVAFRGTRPEVLLPPTRALARARRALSALPGGGATPLAGGIDAARDLAVAARRAGQPSLVVLLTDGRANIDRNGTAHRARAGEQALDAARRLAAEGVAALLVDTSPTPGPKGADLACAMHARYIVLPNAGAHDIARAVVGRPA